MKPIALIRLSVLAVALTSSGCVSYVDDVPATASEVDFDGGQGHTGWARYERTSLLRNVRLTEAMRAGEKALVAHGFALRKSDLAGAVVVGEHGATDWDRNIIAGIYFQQVREDVRVRIHVQASRGVGFFGHQGDPDWTGYLEAALKGTLQR
jgi:hypothetical protein